MTSPAILEDPPEDLQLLLLALNVTWPLPFEKLVPQARVELVPFRDVLIRILDPRLVLSDLLLDRADPAFDLCGRACPRSSRRSRRAVLRPRRSRRRRVL